MDKEQVQRVRNELKAAGVGGVGLHTPEAKALARILHPEEHIGGVVYGRYANGLAWLIATDQRVIFLDRKPMHTTMDELTYDVVSGVKSTRAGLVASVTLHTRINDYTFRYVNAKCAQTFVDFIGIRRLESGKYEVASGRHTPAEPEPPVYQTNNAEALDFLKSHDIAVLSTVDRTGNVHGAVIYYLVGQNNLIYILTKSGTGKGRNIYAHSQVALTAFEASCMQTVQLQGIAEVETDQSTKDYVFTQFVKPRPYQSGMELPPVTKLHDGAFMIIRITPSLISFHDYTKVT